MNKFGVLLKKELKDMITLQTMLPMIICLVLFFVLGQFVGNVTSEASKKDMTITVADMDNTPLTAEILEQMKAKGYTINLLNTSEIDNDGVAAAALKDGGKSAVILEKGFEESVKNGAAPKVSLHTRITSFSIMGTMESSQAKDAVDDISNLLETKYLSKNGITNTELLDKPVEVNEYTHVNDKSSKVNAELIKSIAYSQTIFVPIIIFMIVVFASQMTATAIANEKGNKTLETLLSTPVSRLSVLFSKMTAAGISSLITAVIFMVGFSSYMGSMMGGMTGGMVDGMAMGAAAGSATDIGKAMIDLGIALGPIHYLIIGIQLFVTILIALSISTMLGAMTEDVKGVQNAVAPVMFCVMIPYFVSLFADVNTLPAAARALLYLIPFTHTFIATSEITFRQYGLLTFGFIYQIIFLVVSMIFAVKLFSSDKLFTAKLNRKAGKRKMTA